MKKIYSKPEIAFESFAMNVNIAACKVDTDLQAKGTCGIPYGGSGLVLFLDGISQCTYPGEDGFENTCYHNPTDDTRLFAS